MVAIDQLQLVYSPVSIACKIKSMYTYIVVICHCSFRHYPCPHLTPLALTKCWDNRRCHCSNFILLIHFRATESIMSSFFGRFCPSIIASKCNHLLKSFDMIQNDIKWYQDQWYTGYSVSNTVRDLPTSKKRRLHRHFAEDFGISPITIYRIVGQYRDPKEEGAWTYSMFDW